MIVLAGPNGSGKSTLYETRVAPSFAGPFINADIIQRDELNDSDPGAAYEAARIAETRRQDHLDARLDFVTETVFSHPSKLELVERAMAMGFDVIVMHVAVETPDLSVERVTTRVEEGGHAVPPAKVRERYERSGGLIRQAVRAATTGMVFDNSRFNTLPVRCLLFNMGKLTFALPHLPNWVRTVYADDLTV